MVNLLKLWLHIRTILAWFISISFLVSIFIILPFSGSTEVIDLKVDTSLDFFLKNSLLLEEVYPSPILGERTLTSSTYLYAYIILTILLMCGSVFKPIGTIVRGFLVSTSIHIAWAYSNGKVVLLKLGNMLIIERKLMLEEKIELFNKIMQEIKPKIIIGYNDIATDLAGINDPLEAELLIKTYINKINVLAAEGSYYVDSSIDYKSWILGAVIIVGSCLFLGFVVYLTKGGVSAADVSESIIKERKNIIKPIDAINKELEQVETVLNTAGNIHQTDAIIQKGLRDLVVNTNKKIDDIALDFKANDEELLEQIKTVMNANNDSIYDTMLEVTKQTNANLATKDWVKAYIKEYLKNKIL